MIMAFARRGAKTLEPFSVPPSQAWDGNDGKWSTFMIGVGTPAQTFRVLPSTAGQETWVPAPEGCELLPNVSTEQCGDMRGAQVFQNAPSDGFVVNESSTWESIALYELGLEQNLNYTGNGRYGYDTIGLGIDAGLALNHSIIAGTASSDFMLGMFGLGPLPTNFSGFDQPQPSYMSTLKNQSLIPSLSFGYSAGASYRDKGVLGSLTLGGYDSAKFTPNNMTFAFGPNPSRSLLVGLQSIQAGNALNGVVSLLPQGILALVDSTIPEIWLPVEACKMFETSFGLVYDPQTDRYLVNDTIHSQLQKLNPTLTFQLGNAIYGGEFVNIEIPYTAFDLQATYPIYPNETNYFPLRRAANDTQYTIGRTFLQESYLIVDYERSNFTIAQSVFPDNPTSKIVSILSPDAAKPHSGLSLAERIGIILGCAVVALLALSLLGFGIFKLRRRKKNKNNNNNNNKRQLEIFEKPKGMGVIEELPSPHHVAYEVPSPHRTEYQVRGLPSPQHRPYEVRGWKRFSEYVEMDGGIVHEIGGVEITPELPAASVMRRQEDDAELTMSAISQQTTTDMFMKQL